MTKESLYELQKIDCNCNDCGFMVRNLLRLPQKGIPSPSNFGYCNKFEKDISFIPSTCLIETQQCFIHRKDIQHDTQNTNPK